MTRPSVARIDLSALVHNYQVARRLHGGRALAVVKANAYGHGATRCAHALRGYADGFAVAFLAEARDLRSAGINEPILLLEGVFDAAELEEATKLGVWTVVHHDAQLRMVEEADMPTASAPLQVWLKVDSGMHRAGFALDDVAEAYRRLKSLPRVEKIVLMTHFAQADEPEDGSTERQVSAFDGAVSTLPGERSLCNSAGILGWKDARRDWGRPGILLYGADPMPVSNHGLKAVMTLESTVFAERTIRRGERLGYGGRFVAEEDLRVGLVAIGYADGYPRGAPTGTPVAVDGRSTRLIGRVSMDMLTVDLSSLPEAGIGSRVELWGRHVHVNTVARAVGTIAYELLCNVKRVDFEYVFSPAVEAPHWARGCISEPGESEEAHQGLAFFLPN